MLSVIFVVILRRFDWRLTQEESRIRFFLVCLLSICMICVGDNKEIFSLIIFHWKCYTLILLLMEQTNRSPMMASMTFEWQYKIEYKQRDKKMEKNDSDVTILWLTGYLMCVPYFILCYLDCIICCNRRTFAVFFRGRSPPSEFSAP